MNGISMYSILSIFYNTVTTTIFTTVTITNKTTTNNNINEDGITVKNVN